MAFAVTGVLFNTLTIVVISKGQRIGKQLKFQLVNLAVADLVTAGTFPIYWMYRLLRLYFPLNDAPLQIHWINFNLAQLCQLAVEYDHWHRTIAGHIFPSTNATLLAEMEDHCGCAHMGYGFCFEIKLTCKLTGALSGQNLHLLCWGEFRVLGC